MAWNPPALFVSGATLLASQLNQIRDSLKAIGDPWTAFTPTWGSVTLGTTGLVNTGSYIAAGKFITVKFNLVLGTGGAFTGGPTFLLPVPAADSTLRALGMAFMSDSGSSSTYRGAAVRAASATVVAFTGLDVAGANLSATVPWTWAAGDTLAGTFTYEAA